VEAVLELSENVRDDVISSIDAGSESEGVSPSFVIDEVLVIYNQDPRFSAATLGAVGQVIPRSILFDQGIGKYLDVMGHLVSEHVLFVHDVGTSLINPNSPIVITAERFWFNIGGNDIHFIGLFDRPQGSTLRVTMADSTGTYHGAVTLTRDPKTGIASYSFRSKDIRDFRVRLLTAPTLLSRRMCCPTRLTFVRRWTGREGHIKEVCFFHRVTS
jgi:hypothetical protein